MRFNCTSVCDMSPEESPLRASLTGIERDEPWRTGGLDQLRSEVRFRTAQPGADNDCGSGYVLTE